MDKIIYAVGQIQNNHHNSEKNIEDHTNMILLAAENKADFILFPEMSITGYLNEEVKDYSFQMNDKRLNCFAELSGKYNILISIGVPLEINKSYYIGSLIFSPDGTCSAYTKKYLHPGEERFFSASSEHDPVVQIGNDKISHAICYDIEIDAHINAAVSKQANIYAAGIFYSRSGIKNGLKRLSAIAKEKNINVIMANYTGICRNTESGGCSSIWSESGELIIQSGSDEKCLLLGIKSNDGWEAKKINTA